MRRAILCLPLLLAGCAQGPTLQERLSVWIGRSELDLVTALGVPNRTYELEGRRFLQYEQRRTVPVAAPAYDPWYGPWGPRAGYWPPPPSYAVVECDVTFIIRQDRVENFTFRGQGCS
ncbi:hypothetical protein [Falsiroseomonas bella]|nr:hypothetical protein [Falsiroseomonas bella]